ncbi:electron transport complex subunit RsxG [Dechloromonas sp. XY25]|uniref:Ion-translocating oxidoreductase complex subunit G n=1 Tax=Dechloromonas hankyongensis TaxID=2908002 RepID=A0ABS9K1M4_9RHOO|nr:electron transport complex subunit RsxG [Dechloromonas hankyongensis]MCG2577026.1 electron transport complex subunit RsxG [Dechloromonas hankyongensis]
MTTSQALPLDSQAKMFRHGLILGLFCLGFGLLLAITDEITLDNIAARAMEDKQNSLGQVLPDELHDNNPVTDTLELTSAEGRPVTIYRARKGGQVSGVAYEILGTGYAGEIKLMMGIDAEGKVLGVRVLAHKETPGLGDKIEVKKGPWIERFTGLSAGNPPLERWKVKKDGGDFDQFAGATITPRGVMAAIRGGLEFFAEHKSQLTKAD